MLLLLATVAVAAEPTWDLPGEVMPDRHFDVLDLELAVRIDLEARALTGTTRHTLRALGPAHGTVRLHQVALDVSTVRVDGAVVEGWRLGTETLDIPVPADKPELVVEVDYAATPENGMHFRGGRDTGDPVLEAWTQGEDEDNRYWFPSWDHPNDKFTVTTHVTLDRPFVALANGVHTGTADNADGTATWSYRLDRPIVNYLVAVSAGDLATYDDESGGVPLVYAAARTVAERDVRRTLATVGPQVPYLSELLGHPYPYPVYRQSLVSRFLYGGMENATLTVLADGLLVTEDGDPALRTESVVAHELAHQWFGDLLTCYGWRELWLNEGFATFYAARWMEHAHGPEYAASQLDRWLTSAAGQDAPMAARAWSKVAGRANAGVYVRGASVLHMLRVYLGDDLFDAAIRTYVARHADRLVETSDLRRAVEDTAGTHLGWLFDPYVHGVGVPTLSTRWSHEDGELTVIVDQKTEGASFTVPVEITIGGAPQVTRKVWLSAGQTRLVLEQEARPRWVAIDPRGGVLARWTHTQDAEAWAAQATEAPEAYARLVAIEQLGEAKASDLTLDTLAAVLADPARHASFREHAARSLGKVKTEAAARRLLASVRDPSPRTRAAVAEALGHVEQSTAVVRALEALTRDDDPWVIADALKALVKHDRDAGLRAARAALARGDRTPNSTIHEAALEVLGEHGRDADWGVVFARTDPRRQRSVRHTALEAAADLSDDFDDAGLERKRRALIPRLVEALDDPDLRARQLAISLLGRVGSEAEAVRLDAFAQRTEVRSPDLPALARDAASVIRGRASAGTESTPDGPDLEAVTQELEELERRLERLEEWR